MFCVKINSMCVEKIIEKRFTDLTNNNTGLFGKIGVHMVCIILGLGGVISSVYAVSHGYPKVGIALSVAAIVVSVIGFVTGIIAESKKKTCKCQEEEENK